MIRIVLAALLLAGATTAQAKDSKEEYCGQTANVVGAIQQARLSRVSERKVAEKITAEATWPERFNSAIPLLVPWVYEKKMREVRNNDLAAAWKEVCEANWEVFKEQLQ